MRKRKKVVVCVYLMRSFGCSWCIVTEPKSGLWFSHHLSSHRWKFFELLLPRSWCAYSKCMHIYARLFLILLFACLFSNLRQFVAIQYDMIVNHLLILLSLLFWAFLSFPMPKPSWIFPPSVFPPFVPFGLLFLSARPFNFLKRACSFTIIFSVVSLDTRRLLHSKMWMSFTLVLLLFVEIRHMKIYSLYFLVARIIPWFDLRAGGWPWTPMFCLFSWSEEQREKGKERRVEMFFLS